MSLRTSRPASHPDAVALACDANQIAIAAAVALHIDEAEPERRFDLCVCTPDWDAIQPGWLDLPIRWVEIDVAAVPAFQHPKAWISVGTFYRHLLPGLLAPDYARLLYVDTDVHLRRPGIQGLLDRVTESFAIAASPDFVAVKAPRKARRRRSRELVENLGGEHGEYWQAGVLLMQTAPHVEARLGPRILAFATDSAEVLHRHRLGDQAALNAVAADEIVPMSPLWNWHSSNWLRAEIVRHYDPWILHFTGPNKPWVIQDDPFVAELTPQYTETLRRLVPDWTPKPREGSLAWYAQNPRYGFAPADALHRALRRRRIARKFGAETAQTIARYDAMDRLIANTRIG
jgi:Glycosyl transferase family 8